MIVYFNGKITKKELVGLSPDERGFLFADGAYEVLRAYNGKLFRASDHINRLERSLKELRITGFEPKKLTNIARELLGENKIESGNAIFYIQVTRGAAPRKHTFPEPGTPPTVYAASLKFSSVFSCAIINFSVYAVRVYVVPAIPIPYNKRYYYDCN